MVDVGVVPHPNTILVIDLYIQAIASTLDRVDEVVEPLGGFGGSGVTADSFVVGDGAEQILRG